MYRVSIIILFIIIGCTNYKSIDYLSFSSNNDCMDLVNLLNISDTKKLVTTGSYSSKDKCVCSQFIYKEKFYIDVIKIDKITENYKFNLYCNEFGLKPGFYQMITDDENRLEVLYDNRINNNNKKINKIDLLLNGSVINIPSKNNVSSYLLNSDEFCIKLNENDKTTIAGSMKNNQVILSFYKSNSSIYIFVISLKSGENISPKLFRTLIDEFFTPLRKVS